jgi:hypothetical protein
MKSKGSNPSQVPHPSHYQPPQNEVAGNAIYSQSYSSSSSSSYPAPQRQLQQPQQQSYEEYMSSQQGQAQSYSSGGDQHAGQKKRKDRDFELQLMSGDLSGLNDSSVQDISVKHDWDSFKYTEQQQREQEIQKGFGIGTNKALMQVSKQQNRKHQLSSLAIKAAETELSMLEKRGSRMLSKSQTQGKYGW